MTPLPQPRPVPLPSCSRKQCSWCKTSIPWAWQRAACANVCWCRSRRNGVSFISNWDAIGRQGGASDTAQADSNGREGEAAHPLGLHEVRLQVFPLAARIVDQHLLLLQKRDLREMAKVLGAQPDAIQQAIDFIRSLDPRPGQRFNRSDARLIEPDVAFVKRGGEFVVVMNEEDLPTLRLHHGYRKLLSQQGTERDVKEYVKERYRSALQLMRNIEQRKNTILRTCEAIVPRQCAFLERGVDALKPIMITDVAAEIVGL